LTQDEMAKMLGCSRVAVTRMESGSLPVSKYMKLLLPMVTKGEISFENSKPIKNKATSENQLTLNFGE